MSRIDSRSAALQWLYGPPWRWRLARSIERRLTTVPDYLEPHPLEEEDRTVQAIVALRQHETCGTGIDHLNPNWISALRDAHLAHRDPAKRLMMEAFVLAGEGTEEIGKRVGLPATSVAEYERCFFDVRTKLTARDFILDRVIDGRTDLDLLERQLLRHAFLGGVVAAEHWLTNAPFLGKGIDHDLTTAEGRQREHLELLLLQGQVDLDGATPAVLEDLATKCEPIQPLPTVGELVQGQIDRTIQQLPDHKWSRTRPIAFLEPFRSPGSVCQSA